MYKDLVKGKYGFDYNELQHQRNSNSNTFLKIVILLLCLQISRIALKESMLFFVNDNLFNNYIISTITILVLLIFMLYKANKDNISLELLSYMKTFESKSYYIVVTLSILSLIIISMFYTYNNDIETIVSTVYIIIIVPIYEEIIFRSYIWKKLESEYEDSFKTYLVTSALFSVWQIGYIDIIAMNVAYSSIWVALLAKCSIMLSLGLFIGYFRFKLKNTYSCILIHTFVNIFRI